MPGPVRLVFGDDGGTPAIPDVTLHGGGRITGLRLRIGLRVVWRLTGGGRITGLRLQVGAQYLTNTARPTVDQAIAPWTPSNPLQTGTQDQNQDTEARLAGAARGGTHAIDLLAIRVRAADHAQQQCVACVAGLLRAFGQVLQAKEHTLAGAATHVGGGDLGLGERLSHVKFNSNMPSSYLR